MKTAPKTPDQIAKYAQSVRRTASAISIKARTSSEVRRAQEIDSICRALATLCNDVISTRSHLSELATTALPAIAQITLTLAIICSDLADSLKAEIAERNKSAREGSEIPKMDWFA